MNKAFLLLLLAPLPLFAVSMNFNGHFRSDANYYNNLDLASNQPKSFISGRALLQPNLVVDDHFSVRSQWSLLTSPTLSPDATQGLGAGQGGYVFGDPSTVSLALSRAWLEWTSDFGVFRIGRMPVSWGYGLIWDAGNGVWDDFQTTYDRLEYRLHLGHVIGALAYSKARKLSVLGNVNDQDFYTLYLQYDNPEIDVEGGILYEKQSRSIGQKEDYLGTPVPAVSPNPYKLPATHPSPYPLSNKGPYPMSNNVVDVYLKKTMGYFTIGGEVGWYNGSAFDYNGDGTADSMNALGVMLSTSYEYHRVKGFLEFLYASGDADLNANHLNGFVGLNRNRRPGLILGRELLGPYHSNTVGMGSLVVYGDPNTFSGVIYLRPGLRVDWSPSWASGIELIIAQKAAAAAGEAKNLGVEVDIGTEYSVYKNFDLGVNIGYLFAGNGLRVGSPKGVAAIRATAALRF